jgi:hypothetical protein
MDNPDESKIPLELLTSRDKRFSTEDANRRSRKIGAKGYGKAAMST